MFKKKKDDDFSFEDFEVSEEIVEDFNYYYIEDEEQELNKKIRNKHRLIFASFFVVILTVFITILGAIQMFNYNTTQIINKNYMLRAEIIRQTEKDYEYCKNYFYVINNTNNGLFIEMANKAQKEELSSDEKAKFIEDFETMKKNFDEKKASLMLDGNIEENRIFNSYLKAIGDAYILVNETYKSFDKKEDYNKALEKLKENYDSPEIGVTDILDKLVSSYKESKELLK